jgi:diketogulonate reductase-like aldo/keto reductase
VCWSPLGRGLLAGAALKAAEGRRSDPQLQRQIEQHRPQLEAYDALCRELGEQPAAVALAWLLHNPAVTAPIIGPRTTEQLTTSLRAIEIALSDEMIRRLDEIWSGPGGEAPQDLGQLDKAINRAQQGVGQNVILEAEAVEQRLLPYRPPAHHGHAIRHDD